MHALRSLAFLGVAAALVAAGCIQATPSDDIQTAGLLDDALAFLVADHDHLDPALHIGALGLEELAYDPLSIGGTGPRTFGELDIVGDLAVVAVLEPIGGFVTIDISDPAAPKPLGWYEAGAAYAADVKLSPDGAHAFFAANAMFARDQIPANPMLAPTVAQSSGVHVVNVKDPANPVQESFYALPTGGSHMLDLHVIDGELYVFNIQSSRTGLPAALPLGTPAATSFVDISRMEELPGGTHQLTHVSRYAAPEAQKSPVDYIGPHDITVVDDPELGVLMLCACGTAGASIVDVNDPEMPKHLGTWTGHDGLYVHTVMMTYVDVATGAAETATADAGAEAAAEATTEAKRVLVAVPETFAADMQQPLWIIDASDPANMETLGTWRLPGDDLPYDGGYKFSTHNFNILDNKIFLAHFHGGVWVLDISTEERLAAPEVVAHYSPHRADVIGPSLGIPAVPLVWDVVPAKGKVFVADITTGFHVLEPGFEMSLGLAYGDRGASA